MKLRHLLFLYTFPIIILFVALNQSIISISVEAEIHRTLKTQLNSIIYFIHNWTETLIRTSIVDLEILGSNDSFGDLINYRRYGFSEEEKVKRLEISKILNKLLAERTAYLAIEVFSNAEKLPLIVATKPGISLTSLSSHEKFLSYGENIEATLPFPNQGLDDQILVLRHRLTQKGIGTGNILVHVSLRELLSQIDKIQLIYGTHVSIQDRDRNELLSQREAPHPSQIGRSKRDDGKLVYSDPRILNPFAWEVRLVTPQKELNALCGQIDRLLFGLFALLMGVLSVAFYYLSRKMSNPAEKIVDRLKMNSSIENEYHRIFDPELEKSGLEFREIAAAIDQMLERLRNYHSESIKLTDSASRAEVAHQVAHDIRSPLAALKVAVQESSELSEESRLLIRGAIHRITDIANTLIKHNSPRQPHDETREDLTPGTRNTILLSSLVESVLTEKRLQYRTDINTSIYGDTSESCYGLFAEVDEVELKRAISNLIDNAVEAKSSQIKVSLGLQSEQVILSIQDNGVGICPERLNKLGKKGITFKKEGAGLGLYQARKTAERAGGRLVIESEIEVGTTIRLQFPQAPHPPWFLPDLRISENTQIVILDDDPSIHQVWDNRLEKLNIKKTGCEILHFFSGQSLSAWYGAHPEPSIGSHLYLVDYELLHEEITGLELIQNLGISNESVLVTSHDEQPGLLDRYLQTGVRMIPKSLASTVPIYCSE